MPLKQLLPWWLGLCALAALAWIVTVDQANGMGIGPGTMGLTLLAFLALWVVMMAAMMLPSVAPMVIVWVRSVSVRATAWQRVNGVAQFLAGYLIVWAAFGLLAPLPRTTSDEVVQAQQPAELARVPHGEVAVAVVHQHVCLARLGRELR